MIHMIRRAVIALSILCLPVAFGCDRETARSLPEQTEQNEITFLFFSDTQAEPETGDYSGVGALISEAVARFSPELVIFGGDTVNDGGDAGEWRDFKKAAAELLSGPLIAAAPGNHDNYPLLAEQFDYPSYAPEAPGEGFFYSFSRDGVFFIVLDSNIMGAANKTDIDRLRNDLSDKAAILADWRIAVMHHPVWPVTDNPKDTQRAETMREYFLPVLEEHGVDLILCGHQHVYSRSFPMHGDNVSKYGPGIIQIMAASGAKESYAAAERDYITSLGDAPNYLSVTASARELRVTACNGNHEPFDKTVIMR
ncbi:MAG: metallophosphoesterase [Oscillospiraceae bacterium]|nr:metallophosphoesterase [Oscillospiraceae bacterium]